MEPTINYSSAGPMSLGVMKIEEAFDCPIEQNAVAGEGFDKTYLPYTFKDYFRKLRPGLIPGAVEAIKNAELSLHTLNSMLKELGKSERSKPLTSNFDPTIFTNEQAWQTERRLRENEREKIWGFIVSDFIPKISRMSTLTQKIWEITQQDQVRERQEELNRVISRFESTHPVQENSAQENNPPDKTTPI